MKDMKVVIGDRLTDLTPELLAESFADMDSEGQARFFNHVAECAAKWKLGHDLLPFQLQAITEEDGLTLAGRRVMQSIGEYSHWGIVCKIAYGDH